MNLLDNQLFLAITESAWFVSIASGLLVYFITKWLVETKQNKEYMQKIRLANSDLMHILRPVVVQKSIPTKDIMESLILSVVRKYQVNIRDVATINELADQIIKELMENQFLEVKQKEDLVKRVMSLKEIKVSGKHVFEPSKNYTLFTISVLFSFTTIFLSFLLMEKERVFFMSEASNLINQLYALIVLTFAFLLIMLLILIKNNSRSLNRDYNNKSEYFSEFLKKVRGE